MHVHRFAGMLHISHGLWLGSKVRAFPDSQARWPLGYTYSCCSAALVEEFLL